MDGGVAVFERGAAAGSGGGGFAVGGLEVGEEVGARGEFGKCCGGEGEGRKGGR